MDHVDGKAIPPIKVPSINIDAEQYEINRKHRGRAIIINNKKFNHNNEERLGADKDMENIRKLLDFMQFDVTIAQDYKKQRIEELVHKVSSDDHSNNDCFLLIVMTHGDKNKLFARDYEYDVDTLWKYFTPDHCPSLAGKPKIFFINACRGAEFDSGVKLQIDSGASLGNEQKLPTMADFLIVYSTFEGFVSWRNPDRGSWYIQALCRVLSDHAYKRDLLSALTIVNKDVAFNFQSNVPGSEEYHEKKQIPIITSTLTKEVIFKMK